MQIQLRVAAVALSIAFGSLTAVCVARSSANAQDASAILDPFKRMPDGKEWTTANLSVDTDGSYCYEDAELNCRRYGRLYTWDAAQRACQSLRGGWRLPTNDEWQQLARHHGGLMEESDEGGKATYAALRAGGSAGFNVLLGGSRESGNRRTNAWKRMGSIGRDRRAARPPHGSITSAKAPSPSTAIAPATSRWPSPYGASGIDGSDPPGLGGRRSTFSRSHTEH